MRRNNIIFLFFLSILFLPVFSFSKNDSLLFYKGDFSLEADSVKKEKKNKAPWSRAKKAAVFSACLPGSGQLYNRKFVKAGVVYLALGGLGYSIAFNESKYYTYHKALLNRYDGDSSNDTFSQYSEDNLITLKRSYRKFRDLSIMGAAFVYVLQIIDANVDGHLSTFDVDNISFRLSPWNGRDDGRRNYTGLCLSLKLK